MYRSLRLLLFYSNLIFLIELLCMLLSLLFMLSSLVLRLSLVFKMIFVLLFVSNGRMPIFYLFFWYWILLWWYRLAVFKGVWSSSLVRMDFCTRKLFANFLPIGFVNSLFRILFDLILYQFIIIILIRR